MYVLRFGLVWASLVLILPSPVFASKILLLTAGDSSNDAMLVSTLQAQGDSVTVGPTYSSFTGSGLSGYNEVMVIPGYNQVQLTGSTYSAPDMPTSGQQALLNFVNAGGGLVTGEGLVNLTTGGIHDFQTLLAGIPVQSSVVSTGNLGISFSSLTADPVLNANLPSTFNFAAATGYSGNTESYFLPKAGATPLFSTNQWTSTFGGMGTAYGAVGWNYGQGRVLSLSTDSNNTELADPNYAQLLRNASNWASQSTSTSPPPIGPSSPMPTPEPTTLAVLSLGVAGFLVRSWTRRRSAR